LGKSGKPVPQPPEPRVALPKRDSFAALEAKAREVLRERGFTPAMIEAELKRVRRSDALD
jgi:hypothetical protein